MTNEVTKVLNVMAERFTSGNAVPVERAMITRAEWDAVTAELLSPVHGTGNDSTLALRICTAYEQGFGQAGRDLTNPYRAPSQESEAWNIGLQHGLKRFAAEPTRDASLVLRVTTAYEQGYGDGDGHRAKDNPYAPDTNESQAWNIGWQISKQRALNRTCSDDQG